jgi:hypothetical protein
MDLDFEEGDGEMYRPSGLVTDDTKESQRLGLPCQYIVAGLALLQSSWGAVAF